MKVSRLFQAPAVTLQSETSTLAPHRMTTMWTVAHPEAAAAPHALLPRYSVSFAENTADLHAALRLRYEVFNLELHEGLAASHLTRQDSDVYDDVCDHLIVRDAASDTVVGTYRLQTGSCARAHLGYYSEREFDMSPYETLRPELAELGRACIAREHRSYKVLMLLWRGIAEYARKRGCRYLIGCSSLPTVDSSIGMAAFRQLQDHLVTQSLRTSPRAGFVIEAEAAARAVKIPKLLRTYIAAGARICGEPAIDREFGTIDFLTLMDLEQLTGIRNRLTPTA